MLTHLKATHTTVSDNRTALTIHAKSCRIEYFAAYSRRYALIRCGACHVTGNDVQLNRKLIGRDDAKVDK